MPASTPAEISSFYQQIPLSSDSRSIRVLDVQGLPDKDDQGPIRGTLKSVDLEAHHNFTALSYVCGTPATGEHLVACGETHLAVTENCYAALKHLYLRLGQFTIWVDAVCIHQQDAAEKAHQIAAMGNIFSSASMAYVWLGLGTPERLKAMEYLSQARYLKFFTVDGDAEGALLARRKDWAAFRNVYRARWLSGWQDWGYRLRQLTGWFGPGASEIDLPSRYHACLTHLLSTEWIDRIWTYQEILSAQHAVVVCGTTHVVWPLIAYGIAAENLDRRKSDRNDRLVSWQKLVFTKAQFDSMRDSSEEADPLRLGEYAAFVAHVSLMDQKLLFFSQAIAVVMILACWAWAIYDRVTYRFSLAADICVLVGVVPLFGLLYSILFPGREDARLRMPDPYINIYQREDSVDGLIDALSTRKASVDLDMAFGVRSILEKLLHRKLPVPDPSETKLHIYRKLTTDVLNATLSTDPLLIAAIQHFDDGPSLVVDWTPSHPDSRILVGDYLPPNMGPEYSSTTPSTDAKFTLSDESITIRAFPLCNVVTCEPFQVTNDKYIPSEESAHLSNLAQMMLAYPVSHWRSFWAWPEKADVDQILERMMRRAFVDEQSQGSHSYCRRYMDLLRHFVKRHRSPRQLLSYLQSDGPSIWLYRQFPAWLSPYLGCRTWSTKDRREILKVHVTICNFMARSKQRLFCPSRYHKDARRFGHSANYWGRKPFGFGTGDIQANDLALVAPGFRVPLLVRKTGDGSVRIIGLAVLPQVNNCDIWRSYIKQSAKDNLPEFRIT